MYRGAPQACLFPIGGLFVRATLVYSTFFVHVRYRMVLEPFLILFAARFLVLVSRSIRLASPSAAARA